VACLSLMCLCLKVKEQFVSDDCGVFSPKSDRYH